MYMFIGGFMKDNGRPKLGHSNIYWIRLDEKKKRKPVVVEKEVLEEPIVMTMEKLDDV